MLRVLLGAAVVVLLAVRPDHDGTERLVALPGGGDLDTSATAAEEAGSACGRLGHPVPGPGIPDDPGGPIGPGGKQCVTTPC